MIEPVGSVARDSSTALALYGTISVLNTATPPQNVQGVDILATARPVTPVRAIRRQTAAGRELGYLIDTYA